VYRESERRLYRAMIAIVERTDVVDAVTLANELDKKGELKESGGKEYIAHLIDAVATSANIEYHARIVREKALLRRLIEVSTSIVQESYAARLGANELLDEAEHRILQLSRQRGQVGFVRLKQLLWPMMEWVEQHGRGGRAS